MPKRARQSRLQQQTNPAHRQGSGDGFVHFSQIPGVRIAYIGQPTTAVEEIRAYWRARRAVFMLHRPGAGELELVLERADIVFLAIDCVDRETERRVEARCAHLERPIVVLEEGSRLAVEQALRTWYPLSFP